ncbi:MAG: DUF616 domain-containing protein [Bacteroidales bacterium]|nr:DUF616 domain-containing protein [Bacteroidales bacterium]
MNKKVIYTALTGGHDLLRQPLVTAPGWDYVCFTDRDGQEGVWSLRKIPFQGSPVQQARQVKLQPHRVLPEYETSVWMDANLCICRETFYTLVDKALENGCSLAGVPHPDRDCVFDELVKCYRSGRIAWAEATRHLSRLIRMGMPRHFGLFETNVLLRAHMRPEIIELDDAWWELFLRCCTRDQLSFTPVLACGKSCGDARVQKPRLLFGAGRNARNVDFIQYSVHPGGGGPTLSPLSFHLRSLLSRLLRQRIQRYDKSTL